MSQIVLSARTLAGVFDFLAEIEHSSLSGRVYREGGAKSVVAGRYVKEETAAYLLTHCGIHVERKGTGGGGGK